MAKTSCPTRGRCCESRGQRGKILLVDLEQSEIGFLMNTDESRFEDVAFADGHGAAGIAGQGQGDANALRAFDDVGVGHDVAGGIDDHAGADGMLAHDESGLSAVLFVHRAVAGDQDLNYGGRHFCGETLQSIVELHEGCHCGADSSGLVALFVRRLSVRNFASGSWIGRLLSWRLLRHQACGREPEE